MAAAPASSAAPAAPAMEIIDLWPSHRTRRGGKHPRLDITTPVAPSARWSFAKTITARDQMETIKGIIKDLALEDVIVTTVIRGMIIQDNEAVIFVSQPRMADPLPSWVRSHPDAQGELLIEDIILDKLLTSSTSWEHRLDVINQWAAELRPTSGTRDIKVGLADEPAYIKGNIQLATSLAICGFPTKMPIHVVDFNIREEEPIQMNDGRNHPPMRDNHNGCAFILQGRIIKSAAHQGAKPARIEAGNKMVSYYPSSRVIDGFKLADVGASMEECRIQHRLMLFAFAYGISGAPSIIEDVINEHILCYVNIAGHEYRGGASIWNEDNHRRIWYPEVEHPSRDDIREEGKAAVKALLEAIGVSIQNGPNDIPEKLRLTTIEGTSPGAFNVVWTILSPLILGYDVFAIYASEHCHTDDFHRASTMEHLSRKSSESIPMSSSEKLTWEWIRGIMRFFEIAIQTTIGGASRKARFDAIIVIAPYLQMPFRSVLINCFHLNIPESPFRATEKAILRVAFGRRVINMRQFNVVIQKNPMAIETTTVIIQAALVSSKAASERIKGLIRQAIRAEYYFGDDIEVDPIVVANIQARTIEDSVTEDAMDDHPSREDGDHPMDGDVDHPRGDIAQETLTIERTTIVPGIGAVGDTSIQTYIRDSQ